MNADNQHNIRLSYVLATKNKLPYLKESIPRLLAQIGTDEEVVVVDGASSDGGREYLSELYAQGRIHQFLSEPDKCEAHGENKALLMARGELIKPLADDDVFHYPTIRKCKEFMLANPNVDVLCGDAFVCDVDNTRNIRGPSFRGFLEPWLRGELPCIPMAGLTLLIRRKSIPLLGLLHTGVASCIDYEFGMRASSVGTTAWCTAPLVLAVVNPSCGTHRMNQLWAAENARIDRFYDFPRQDAQPEPRSLARRIAGLVANPRRLAHAIGSRLRVESKQGENPASAKAVSSVDVARVFVECENWLDEQHGKLPNIEILLRPSKNGY